MVQPLVIAQPYLDARLVEQVYVVGVPLPGRVAVLILLGQQADLYATVLRGYGAVGVTVIREPVHDDVYFLRLLVYLRSRAVVEILRPVRARREVQRGVNRISRVAARQRAGDVRIVGVVNSIRPQVIHLRLEAVDDRRVIREVNSFVKIVHVRLYGGEEI